MQSIYPATRTLARSSFLIALVAVAGCGNSKSEGGKAPNPAAPPPPASSGERHVSATFDDRQVHQDLVQTAFLADVEDRGVLSIDFGTPARQKYTIGNWRTGFLQDATTGKETYSLVGDTARVFFQADAPGPLVLRVRARPIGGRNLTMYMNNKALPTIRMEESTGFLDYEVAVPAEMVERGENQILMRFGGTQKVNGLDVGAALASLLVSFGAAPPAKDVSVASYPTLVTKAKADGEERRALALPAGRRYSFYVQVPPDAELGIGAARASGKGEGKPVTVRITPEGARAVDAAQVKVGDEWENERVSLKDYAGQVVRVDVALDAKSPVAAAVGPLAVLVPETKPEKLEQPKNVVVLLVDTLRADKLHPFNAKSRVETPVIDELAKAGTVFVNAQSPENWTKPSCASVLTSLYPVTHGAKTDAAKLPASVEMVSEHLKAAGFHTGSFIANGYVSDKFGFDQGWDHYTNFIRENKSTEAENVFKEAADWIEKNKAGRFFTYIQTIDPHVPYDPPDAYLAKYDTSAYDGQVKPRMTADLLEKAKRSPPVVTFNEADKRRLLALHDGEISYHDHQLGVFIDRLKKMGVWDNTLFVLTADHGEEFNDHGSWGHGHSVYQELLHVPLFFHGKGFAPAARVENVVSTVDIVPTVLDIAGMKPMAHQEGRSLVGYLQGAPPAGPSVAFSDFLDDRRVIVTGQWKLILRGINSTFFDLGSDPGEQRELSRADRPIAFRYARVMQGQFLGASDLGRWLDPDDQRAAKKVGQENAEMDQTTRDQLRALGYAN